MEKDVFERLRAILKEKDFSRKKLAAVSELPLSTVTTNISGVTKQPSYAIIEAVLYQFPDISAEWLVRGKGGKYISDIPADGDNEQVLDLKAELTRKEGEIEGLRQTIADLKVAIAKREAQLDKLINILHEERQPSLSIVAEEPTYTNTNNLR